jgi:intracellular sulfur oxidation DsrE/DsrF family protein
MVRQPLTHVKKIETDKINQYINTLKEEKLITNEGYAEIAVISEANNIKALKENNEELTEQQQKLADMFGEDIESASMNMNLLGIDLSKIPNQSLSDFRVYIIPVLYVISSFVSIKLTTAMQTNKKKEEKEAS